MNQSRYSGAGSDISAGHMKRSPFLNDAMGDLRAGELVNADATYVMFDWLWLRGSTTNLPRGRVYLCYVTLV